MKNKPTYKELEQKIKKLEQAQSEHEQITKQLLESEERFKALHDASFGGVIIHDKGVILDCNQGLSDITGFTSEELIGMDGLKLIAMDSLDLVVRNIKRGYDQHYEVEGVRKDGSVYPLAIRGKNIPYKGHEVRVIEFRDITRRKQAEVETLRSEKKLRKIIDMVPSMIFVKNAEGRFLVVNKAIADSYDLPVTDIVGKLHSNIHPDKDEVKKMLADDRKTIERDCIVNIPEESYLDSKGNTRWLHTVKVPCPKGVFGEPTIIGVATDITERKRMEEELLKIRKLESVGVLAGGIAHDFNNILAAILGNISLALTITDPKDEIYELLEESEKASLRAKDLTQQLLTFSKGGEPIKKIAEINAVIKDSASFVLRGSNVRCDFKFDEELWPVAIDTGQISQVVQNIVINASQAMPTGGTIAIGCLNYCLESSGIIPVSPGDYIKIVVKDQGLGIPVDMLDKIFDPYFTTKQQGSGLGLATTHSIIINHNGHITVDSKLGQGATFTIYLPASQRIPELDPKEVIVPQIIPQGKIMIMDDEKMIRSLVERSLSRSGYEVVLATDGNEAVHLYQKAKEAGAPIHLSIMDLTIPGGMGGKEATKEIHKIDPEAKVIVSSGYSNDPVMADFCKYGFCGAIAKPFQIKELMEVVAKAVSKLNSY
jgi:PAS domain S-box-containing protein